MDEWKPGLPPGPCYDGMVDDFEAYFSPAGAKWHRRRSPEDAAQHRAFPVGSAVAESPTDQPATETPLEGR